MKDHKCLRFIQCSYPLSYQLLSTEVIEGELGRRVSLEAGAKQGWERYIGRKGLSISVEDFACSGPVSYMEEKFGFSVPAILSKLQHNLASHLT